MVGRKKNLDEWIQENQKIFSPSICMKMMYNGQLKVYCVGGPNIGKDYRITNCDQFFYMKQGYMDLYIMENNLQRKITIKQGEVFLLPARVPMSPKRYSNSIGLRAERSRIGQEMDCIRYYTKNNSAVLYERWFNFTDPQQFKPIQDDFYSSDAFKTGTPSKDSKLIVAPYEAEAKAIVEEPFSLDQWLERNNQGLTSGKLNLFEGDYKAHIIVYGPGEDEVVNEDADTFVWALRGTTILDVAGEATRTLGINDTDYIRKGRRYKITRGDGARVIQVVMAHY
ncbi:3-hydroxyanthranilate 3,4-dioxygenase-like [Artemia franciscana]|uniref:3-hydroxyanthranilate 3,4-dioxygenase n=1 Tax=Artemia franciscana TaxID=6661 RepID=A0AA88HB05_ARTSF|nr:hypothetical protein QYM36_015904 [Artemia franciscana]